MKARCPNGHAVTGGSSICPTCFSQVAEGGHRRAALARAPYAGVRLTGAVLGVAASGALTLSVLVLPWIDVDTSGTVLDVVCLGADRTTELTTPIACDGRSSSLQFTRSDIATMFREDPRHPFGALTTSFVDWGALALVAGMVVTTLLAAFRALGWSTVGFVAVVGLAWAWWTTFDLLRQMPFESLGTGLHLTWAACLAAGLASYLSTRRRRASGVAGFQASGARPS